MKIKKNVLIGVLVTAMLAGMALAINASMAYAKDYDGLANESSTANEKKEKEDEEPEYLRKIISDDTWLRIARYKEGLNLEEGITVAQGVKNADAKIEQLHEGTIDYYVTVSQCETPTLESKASWEMEFIVENQNISETIIVMEVDKQTGTCVEKNVDEFIFEQTRRIGRFTVQQMRLDRTFDFNEGITVEKAIQLVEEKSKKMYGLDFSDVVNICNGSRTIDDNGEEWKIYCTPAGQAEKWANISAQINKYTGEITQCSYLSNEMGDRQQAYSINQPDSNRSTDYTRKEAKEEILKYASTQQSSEYHQSAIDFIKKHNLNQGATIEKVQGILEDKSMMQFDYDKNGWRYFVEAELDNGKYIIVEVEKETKEAYGYYETSQSLEERLDAQFRIYERLDRIFEQMHAES